MTAATQPERSRIYHSFITDTRIWADFRLRADDIVVSTPPKCGTTWMQTIVTMLIHGPDAAKRDIRDLSPWLDCAFRDPPAQAAALDAQAHRRCIKSHAPLDGIAFDPDVTYIAVYRHPMDAHFSMRRHVENTNPGFMEPLEARFPQDIERAFEMFVDDAEEASGTDRMTLDGMVHHYRSFAAWRHLPNIHLFHYADLRRDLDGEIARLAAILGYDLATDRLSSIAGNARFDAMQAEARRRYAGTTDAVFRDRAAFFDSASSGKWRGLVDKDLLDRYRTRIAGLLPPAALDWLENGSPDR